MTLEGYIGECALQYRRWLATDALCYYDMGAWHYIVVGPNRSMFMALIRASDVFSSRIVTR